MIHWRFSQRVCAYLGTLCWTDRDGLKLVVFEGQCATSAPWNSYSTGKGNEPHLQEEEAGGGERSEFSQFLFPEIL